MLLKILIVIHNYKNKEIISCTQLTHPFLKLKGSLKWVKVFRETCKALVWGPDILTKNSYEYLVYPKVIIQLFQDTHNTNS